MNNVSQDDTIASMKAVYVERGEVISDEEASDAIMNT
jgi:hypothetical protein